MSFKLENMITKTMCVQKKHVGNDRTTPISGVLVHTI